MVRLLLYSLGAQIKWSLKKLNDHCMMLFVSFDALLKSVQFFLVNDFSENSSLAMVFFFINLSIQSVLSNLFIIQEEEHLRWKLQCRYVDLHKKNWEQNSIAGRFFLSYYNIFFLKLV